MSDRVIRLIEQAGYLGVGFLLQMRFSTFVAALTMGTAAWTSLLAGAGILPGEDCKNIDRVIGRLSTSIMAALVAGYVWRLATHRVSPAISSEPDR